MQGSAWKLRLVQHLGLTRVCDAVVSTEHLEAEASPVFGVDRDCDAEVSSVLYWSFGCHLSLIFYIIPSFIAELW
jgi:hypothetical protein